MRLFVAINLGREIENYLTDLASSNFDFEYANIPKSFHLTLKFLGEINDQKVPEIKEKLAQIKFEKFKMKLVSVGFFGDNFGNVKVVWIGIDADKILFDLQSEIDEAMRNFAQTDNKKFVPHITLARIKFSHDKMLARRIKNIKVEKKEVGVTSFALIKSDLLPSGPKYTEIAKCSCV